MTKETRIVLGPEDVHAAGLACLKCKAEVIVTVGEQRPLPNECPMCGETWQGELRIAKMFIDAIHSLNKQPSDKVHVRLVLDDSQAINS